MKADSVGVCHGLPASKGTLVRGRRCPLWFPP